MLKISSFFSQKTISKFSKVFCFFFIGVLDEVGMDQWNELDDEYAFVYVNPEKGSKKVLVKCLVMNDKLLVDALADGSSEPVHLEIK